jgi:hypothetical protein
MPVEKNSLAGEPITVSIFPSLSNFSRIFAIVDTYKNRKEEVRYSRRVKLSEIEKNDFNLNISRYVSTAVEKNSLAGKPITVSIFPSLSNFSRIFASSPPRNKTPCGRMIAIALVR